MGNVHRYGDHRMPAPGILAAGAASVIAAVAGHPAQSVTAGVAFLLLVGWVVLYLASARQSTAHSPPPPMPRDTPAVAL